MRADRRPGEKKSPLCHIKRLAKNIVLFGYRLLIHVIPVQRKTVVFMSSLGRSYTGNPRAICEEMAREGLLKRFRIYYILDDPKHYQGELPKGVRPLKNARFRYYIVMAAAGIWVSDTRFQNYMIKRKETIYIQTW
ncbi:MAG: CDP-glycerol glycerophosphotransferase family protein, partial [Lachnospiraceae bacterium]|nr:CDP-glycerol glycerophosphotransferase family protein [Lachnospiraceae bacterium]